MSLLEEIGKIAAEVAADLKESKGVYNLECVVAERKGWLSLGYKFSHHLAGLGL